MTARMRLVCSFGGGGGGAAGFASARASLYGADAAFELVGGFDNDPYACGAFKHLTGVEQTVADARELTPGMMRELFGDEAPFCLFGSPPCKGSSKLLSGKKAKEAKYVELNRLALDHVRTILAAWPASPPAFLIFENVPNITSPDRAGPFVAQVRKLLKAAGYILQDGFHECRHVGNLAQRRKRWFLVARNPRKVPAFLYHPPRRPGKVCGDVLTELPTPNDPAGGPMHRLSDLWAINLWRLWAVPAGGDWRDLRPDDGTPRRAIFRRWHVASLAHPAPTVGGPGTNGPCAVAVPLPLEARGFPGAWGVLSPDEPAGTVTGNARPATGRNAIAAPLPLAPNADCFDAGYAVLSKDQPSRAVAATSSVGCGAYAIADDVPTPVDLAPRCSPRAGAYGVMGAGQVAPTVAASGQVDNATVAFADPRPAPPPFVVLSYAEAKRVADGEVRVPFAIVNPARPDVALAIVDDMHRPPYRWVEGPRGKRGKAGPPRKELVPLVLVSADGTWHRPLTILELAVLQGLDWRHRGAPLDFGGTTADQRELIGNMVPPPVGAAIAEQMLLAGLAAAAGSFFLTNGGGGIWVRPADLPGLFARGAVRVRPADAHRLPEGALAVLDDRAPPFRPKRRRAPTRRATSPRPARHHEACS
jgi:site-specific DNA-cytosine methylase